MSGRSLFERLSEDPRVLEKAWKEVNRNARSLSKGIDGIRLDQFSAHAQRHLASLRLSIKDGSFKFQDLRGAAIVKPNGKYRPLQIATIQDRVVQKAIELLIRKRLNNKYNVFNNPVSYAFIKTEDIKGYDESNPQTYKGVRGAVEKLKHYSADGFVWSLKTDIIDFFPNIDTKKLLDEYIFPAIVPDTSLNHLIKQAFEQEIEVHDNVRKILGEDETRALLNNSGLPQGSILSPLFSNVYLSGFDEKLESHGFIAIRYVDDLIVVSRTKSEAQSALKLVASELAALGLSVHPLGHKKTSIQENKDVTFLGIRLKRGSFYPSQEAFQKNIDKLNNFPKYKTLFKNLQSIHMLSQSWASTYYFCENDTDSYKRLNSALKEAVNSTLRKARLRPIGKFGNREMRRLGIHQFDNAVATFVQKHK